MIISCHQLSEVLHVLYAVPGASLRTVEHKSVVWERCKPAILINRPVSNARDHYFTADAMYPEHRCHSIPGCLSGCLSLTPPHTSTQSRAPSANTVACPDIYHDLAQRRHTAILPSTRPLTPRVYPHPVGSLPSLTFPPSLHPPLPPAHFHAAACKLSSRDYRAQTQSPEATHP